MVEHAHGKGGVMSSNLIVGSIFISYSKKVSPVRGDFYFTLYTSIIAHFIKKVKQKLDFFGKISASSL